jgi:hypothetical protein
MSRSARAITLAASRMLAKYPSDTRCFSPGMLTRA